MLLSNNALYVAFYVGKSLQEKNQIHSTRSIRIHKLNFLIFSQSENIKKLVLLLFVCELHCIQDLNVSAKSNVFRNWIFQSSWKRQNSDYYRTQWGNPLEKIILFLFWWKHSYHICSLIVMHLIWRDSTVLPDQVNDQATSQFYIDVGFVSTLKFIHWTKFYFSIGKWSCKSMFEPMQ